MMCCVQGLMRVTVCHVRTAERVSLTCGPTRARVYSNLLATNASLVCLSGLSLCPSVRLSVSVN